MEPNEKTNPMPLEPPKEYFLVGTLAFGDWTVSREMAAAIERDLDAAPAQPWITFVDWAGARVRIRAAQICYLGQSTAEMRASWRLMSKRHQEERDEY